MMTDEWNEFVSKLNQGMLLEKPLRDDVVASLLLSEWDVVNDKKKVRKLEDGTELIIANPEMKLKAKLRGTDNTISVIESVARKINAYGSIMAPKHDSLGVASIHYHISVKNYPGDSQAAGGGGAAAAGGGGWAAAARGAAAGGGSEPPRAGGPGECCSGKSG